MNGKFFDLKKEKQDRMINGALKVFALCGYDHASTDEIVKEAGISKGLLFHYFESKLGTYRFVYDYCTRFLLLELSSQKISAEADLYETEKGKLTALLDCARTYPYFPLFLLQSRQEEIVEALEIAASKNQSIKKAVDELTPQLSQGEQPDENSLMKKQIVTYTIEGILQKAYREKAFQPEQIMEQVGEALEYLKENLQ